MLNINRLLKVTAAWTSVIYIICYFWVASFPGMRTGFMQYGMHMGGVDMGWNILTPATFIWGLIIWNIIDLFAVWLFAFLYNTIKK